MLKISEMADLANTTRRTLIFYDQENVFTPNHRNNNGYRMYDYDQLYDLLFILGLRNLDIPLSDIKNIQSSTTSSKELLSNAQNKINNKISELVKMREVLNKKLASQSITDDS